MAKPARKGSPKPRKSARKHTRQVKPRPPRLVGLVWITAGALSVAVLALAAILLFGPGARDTPTPRVATIQVPAIPAKPPAQPVVQASPPQIAVVPPQPPRIAFVPPPVTAPAKKWLRNATPVAVAPGQPMIAVVIDDMGLDRLRSDRITGLPAPLTLAYLAYASNLDTQTETARAAGHELLVHVSMEPGSDADPGPNALLTGLTPKELDRRIDWSLAQFTRFVGINNHMGSKATSDRPSMAAVMSKLRAKGLLFLDSRTSGATVAYAEAERQGIPALQRDVFLDHDPSPIAVRAALDQVEEIARRRGHAIAIGHPKDATIEALAEWLPDVRSRGFALVPVSAVALRLAADKITAGN